MGVGLRAGPLSRWSEPGKNPEVSVGKVLEMSAHFGEVGMIEVRGRSARHGSALAAAGSVALLTSGLPMLAVAPAGADDVITVTTLADSGAGSLREAITTANGDADHDTIVFSVSGTITLASDLPDIYKYSATIDGTGITIDAAGFGAIRFNDLQPGATATVIGLTVVNGDANQGGGIAINGADYGDPMASATVTGVTLTNNTAISGGGLYVYGTDTVTITDSTFAGNSAGDGTGGGAFISSAASVFVMGSEFIDNSASGTGGGVSINIDNGLDTEKKVTVSTSSFIANVAGDGGGGLELGSGGRDSTQAVELSNSTFAYNDSGAFGGGLYLGLYWAAVIANSTISGNSAVSGGGGIYGSVSGLMIESSTIVANSTEVGAGGIAASGNTSDSGAMAPAQGTAPPGTVSIFGSIVAASSGVDIGVGIDGAPQVIAQQSLIGTVGTGLTFTAGEGTQVGVEPAALLLGELDDNGGPTPTHALGEGSIAIDASGSETPDFPGSEFDQRGAGYIRVVNGALDAGAFEVQAARPTPDPVTPSFTG